MELDPLNSRERHGTEGQADSQGQRLAGDGCGDAATPHGVTR